MLSRADEQDAGALMEIAEYAAREGLYEIARVHYLAAAEQDEAVAGIAQRRLLDLAQQASDSELRRGHDAAASGDEEFLGALGDIGARLDEQDVDNETQLGTAYYDKGDLNRAKQAASSVIAIDRTNREALALLGQIRAAEEERRAATYDVWWYRYRRQRGVYPYPRCWYPGRGRRWGAIRRGGGATGPRTRAPIGVFRR